MKKKSYVSKRGHRKATNSRPEVYFSLGSIEAQDYNSAIEILFGDDSNRSMDYAELKCEREKPCARQCPTCTFFDTDYASGGIDCAQGVNIADGMEAGWWTATFVCSMWEVVY